jgi:hypothetical protein
MSTANRDLSRMSTANRDLSRMSIENRDLSRMSTANRDLSRMSTANRDQSYRNPLFSRLVLLVRPVRPVRQEVSFAFFMRKVGIYVVCRGRACPCPDFFPPLFRSP